MYFSNDKPVELDYRDFGEVLQTVESASIIDIRKYVPLLPKEFLDNLEPAPEGVYHGHLVDPLFQFSDKYHSVVIKNTVKVTGRVNNFDEFVAALKRGEFIMQDAGGSKPGRLICMPTRNPTAMYSPKPKINYSAVKLLFIELFNIVNSLRQETLVYCDSTQYMLNPFNFVEDPDKHEKLTNDNTNAAYLALRKDVRDIVEKYHWHNFGIKVNGTEVCIERHLDYRIIQFYATEFDKRQSLEDAKDAGLVTTGF